VFIESHRYSTEIVIVRYMCMRIFKVDEFHKRHVIHIHRTVLFKFKILSLLVTYTLNRFTHW